MFITLYYIIFIILGVFASIKILSSDLLNSLMLISKTKKITYPKLGNH